jgi:hypothetical protein
MLLLYYVHAWGSFSLWIWLVCKAGRVLHWCFLYDVLGSTDACFVPPVWFFLSNLLFYLGMDEQSACASLLQNMGKVQQYFYAFLQGLMWLLD